MSIGFMESAVSAMRIECSDYAQQDITNISDAFGERIQRAELPDDSGFRSYRTELPNDSGEQTYRNKIESNRLHDAEKAKIKEESCFSNEIIEHIDNIDQYNILKDAGLKELEANGRKCLVKENIDLDYVDEDGISNRERMTRGLAPLDRKNGNPIELHNLGQKADSPLVELTVEEHRTGEYECGKKNQTLWHDNAQKTEVHGEGNHWDPERRAHWKAREEQLRREEIG